MSDLIVKPTRHLLLVTGSRSFATPFADPRKEAIRLEGVAWGKPLVERAILALPPGAIVMHGGAIGPDQWAADVCNAHKIRMVVYLISGWRMDSGGKQRRWAMARQHPLKRDAALVRGCARALADKWVVGCVGVVDEASETHGSDYTMGLCRQETIPVTRYGWHKGVPGSQTLVTVGS